MSDGLPERPDLARALLDGAYVTKARLDEARARAAETGTSLSDALVGLGHITEDQINVALSDSAGIPFVHVDKGMVDPELLERFDPRELARHGVLPLLEDTEELSAAMADPWDRTARDCLIRSTRLPLNASLATRANITQVLRDLAGDEALADEREEQVILEDTSGIAFLYQQILAAVGSGAQELFLEKRSEGLGVRWRQGLEVVERDPLPDTLALPVLARARMLVGREPGGTDEFRDRRTETQIGGQTVALSVSYTRASTGPVMVLRFLQPAESTGDLIGLLGDLDSASWLSDCLDRRGHVLALGCSSPEGGPGPLIGALCAQAARKGRRVVAVGAGIPLHLEGALQLAPPDVSDPGAAKCLDARRALGLAPDQILVWGAELSGEVLHGALSASLGGPAVVLVLPFGRVADILAHLFYSGGPQRALAAATLSGCMALRQVPALAQETREARQATQDELARLSPALAAALEGQTLQADSTGEPPDLSSEVARVWLPERLDVTERVRGSLRAGRLAEALNSGVLLQPALDWIFEGRIDFRVMGR